MRCGRRRHVRPVSPAPSDRLEQHRENLLHPLHTSPLTPESFTGFYFKLNAVITSFIREVKNLGKQSKSNFQSTNCWEKLIVTTEHCQYWAVGNVIFFYRSICLIIFNTFDTFALNIILFIFDTNLNSDIHNRIGKKIVVCSQLFFVFILLTDKRLYQIPPDFHPFLWHIVWVRCLRGNLELKILKHLVAANYSFASFYFIS